MVETVLFLGRGDIQKRGGVGVVTLKTVRLVFFSFSASSRFACVEVEVFWRRDLHL